MYNSELEILAFFSNKLIILVLIYTFFFLAKTLLHNNIVLQALCKTLLYGTSPLKICLQYLSACKIPFFLKI